jgi:2OG-Fe(II) oxygenase superfamily
MNEHYINSSDSFIAGWYHPSTKFCDKLIDHFKSSRNKFQGFAGNNGNTVVDKTVKSCTELALTDEEIASEYRIHLLSVVDLYTKKYPYSSTYGPWGFIQPPNIQYYKPNEAFFKWHSERIDNTNMVVSRHLVFMTYLNDVTEGGETEWFHQKIKIKPEKGLTVIWPADWTFTHRGIPSTTQDKYIITGWFNYINPQHGP